MSRCQQKFFARVIQLSLCTCNPFGVAQQFKYGRIIEQSNTLIVYDPGPCLVVGHPECGELHTYKFPRKSCSRSSASNSALKLPSPKPRAPLRWITSKKTVGRFTTGLEKICSR